MALFANPIEAATGALTSAERRLADFERERAAKVASLAGDLDFETNLAHREVIAVLDRKVAAATDTVGQARRSLEVAKAAEAEAEADRVHKAAEKLARTGEKLTLDVATAAERLAALLADLEANRAAIEKANATRGGRPFIVDGEHRARSVPGRTIPAELEWRDVWEDGAGNTPGQFRKDADGEFVPVLGGYTKKRVKVQTQAERYIEERMPERFASAIQLVDLKGQRIGPRL